MSASPAPTLIPNPVAIWHGNIEKNSERASPSRYQTPTQWATMRESALDFCTRFGAEAHGLGWTASQLFGVHPEHGTLRGEYCGALMIAGKKALAVEAERIRIRADRRLPEHPGQGMGPADLGVQGEGRLRGLRRERTPIPAVAPPCVQPSSP